MDIKGTVPIMGMITMEGDDMEEDRTNVQVVDYALDDVFEWGKIAGYAQDGILNELKRCVEQHCVDEGIPIAEVDVNRTVNYARVALVLEFRDAD